MRRKVAETTTRNKKTECRRKEFGLIKVAQWVTSDCKTTTPQLQNKSTNSYTSHTCPRSSQKSEITCKSSLPTDFNVPSPKKLGKSGDQIILKSDPYSSSNPSFVLRLQWKIMHCQCGKIDFAHKKSPANGFQCLYIQTNRKNEAVILECGCVLLPELVFEKTCIYLVKSWNLCFFIDLPIEIHLKSCI